MNGSENQKFPQNFYLRPAYKPHSVQQLGCLGDHLSGRCVTTPLDAAHPELTLSRWRVYVWRRAASRRPQTTSSLLGLAPSGGYLATRITARAGGLLHHLFTITSPLLRGGGCLFLWPIPAGSRLSTIFPPRGLSDAVLYGVRTFLDPVNAEPRSPDRPEALSSYLYQAHASIPGWEDFIIKISK